MTLNTTDAQLAGFPIHNSQFPSRRGGHLPEAAGNPPKGTEYEHDATDKQLAAQSSISLRRLLNGVSPQDLVTRWQVEDANQNMVSCLEEDIDARQQTLPGHR